ncbi:hypothetical protein C0V73_17645 [Rhizobium sp. TH135]|nr:hypothetical protein C0V73_17645 [Rhizobium sp. TH135]
MRLFLSETIEQEIFMSRNNGLYLIIGALVVAVIGLGIYVYQEEQQPDGVELKIGQNGVSIEEN